MITIRIPAPSSMLVANLIGVLGLLLMLAATWVLAGAPWALLAAGGVLVSLSLIATAHASAAATVGAVVDDGQPRLAEVPSAA